MRQREEISLKNKLNVSSKVMKARTILRTSLLFVVFTLPGLLMASNAETRQNRPVDSFSAIKVSAGIDLYLEPGTREKVEVVGEQRDMDEIITEVKNGTLHVYRKGKFGFNFNFHNNVEVFVTATTLNGLDASSGSEVKSTGTFRGSECRISASSGSEVSLNLEYDKLMADSSSGSEIHLQGKTGKLSVSVSSGSEIKAYELTAGVVQADASSGGEACVNAVSELHANASSGGDINYKGKPQVLDVDKSSGGSVSGN
jgi:hypothetical protein